MSDQSSATTVAAPEGVWADVTIDVTLESFAEQADRISTTVIVGATNRTKASIELKEPYRLPARHVQNATSTLENNEKLQAAKTKDGIAVFFDGRKISTGETIKWKVTYVRTAELYLNRILAYDLFIDPQRVFQDVPVINHHFEVVRVTLLTPDDAGWRPLRRWQLHQRNYPLSVNPKIIRSRDRTICEFGPFDITNESFDLRIAAVYGFKSWI